MIAEKNPITQLALSSIRTDGGTQPRAQINYDTVGEYAQDMMIGVHFPPITVFYDGTDYWLADGFHRYHATKQLCKETIEAEVKQGTRRDAILHSVGANATHGLRRTNADKRRAVETLLRDPEWVKWSNREIARKCGVSLDLVNRTRNETSLNESFSEKENNDSGERTYITKYGTVATMNTSNIGRTQQQNTPVDIFIYSKQTEEKIEYVSPINSTYNSVAYEERINVYEDTPIESREDANIDEGWEVDEEQESIDKWKIEEEEDNTSDIWKQPVQPIMPTPIQPLQEKPIPDIEDAKERRDAHVMRVMGSSDSPEWYTPSYIVQATIEVMGEIDLDPCSNSHETPTVPARTLYTKEDNGLGKQWKGKTYLNPPYGTEISAWTNKLIESYESGNVEEAIALLPGRIDTQWFSPLYAYLLCIVRGRVQFANSPYHAPFPCVIAYLGKREDVFMNTFKAIGPIVKRID